MTIFSEQRYRDLVALQHTAAAKRYEIVGTGWLTTFYKDEFAHTLIGNDRCVCVTASLADEGAADGGHSLVYSSRSFSVNATKQQCGHGATLLFFHRTEETLRILLPIGHEPIDHVATEAFDVPSAVDRECFEVTVAVETGETTINLVSMSDATGAVAVKGPVLDLYIHDRALALAGHADAHPDEDRPGFFNEQDIAVSGTHLRMHGDELRPTAPPPIVQQNAVTTRTDSSGYPTRFNTFYGRPDAEVYPAEHNPSAHDGRASAFRAVLRSA